MLVLLKTTVTGNAVPPAVFDVLPARPRRLRRNSCIIRKDQNPSPLRDYLLDGLLRMSDRDIELQNGVAMSA
jgi:hypothetical protein